MKKKPRRYCGFELMSRMQKEFQEAKDNYGKMGKWVDKWNVIWVEEIHDSHHKRTRGKNE